MLTLYYRPTCPFCRKVLAAAAELGITFNLVNIEEAANAAALVARGGKQQVPYLVDEEKGVEMYESGDIIAYLKKR